MTLACLGLGLRPVLASLNILAQNSATSSIWIWSLVLIGVGVVAVRVVVWFRRSLRKDDVAPDGPAFSLADFREMHKRGQLTDAEFAKARGALVAKARDAPVAEARDAPVAGLKKTPTQGPDTGSDNATGGSAGARPERPGR